MTQERISKTQFKAKALAYLRRVEATGECLIATDKGKPTNEVRRYCPAAGRPLDHLKGSMVAYTDPTEPVATENWDVVANP